MKARIALFAVLTLVSSSAWSGGIMDGYSQGQAQQLEIQRLQLCNQALQLYQRGGPPPPAMCGMPSAVAQTPSPYYTPPTPPPQAAPVKITDFKCLNQCTAQGHQLGFCTDRCSYTDP